MPECRFLLDEGALSLDDVPEAEREDSLMALIDQLDALRVSGESIQLVENWGAVECLGGNDVAETMVHCRVLNRDQSQRLLTLLDRCVAWNRPAAVDVDSEVVVDGSRCKMEGIAWAHHQAILQIWTAVVTTPHRFVAGVHRVDKPSQSLPVDVYFAASIGDHPGFFRLLYEWEDASESDFFERARLAFLGWYLPRTSAFANSKARIAHCDLRWSIISDELTIDSRRYTQLRTVCQMKYRAA